MYNRHRVFYSSFWRYRLLIGATIFFSLLAACFEGFSIGMLIPFLQTLSDESRVFETGISWLDHTFLGHGESQLVRMYYICGIILVATWLRTIFGYFASILGVKARVSIIEDLRLRVVDQLQSVSLSYFATTKAGDILNTFTNELGRVSHAMNIVTNFITRGMLVIVYLAFMFWVSWELSLLVIAFFGVLSFALTYLVRTIKGTSEDITRANSKFTSHATEFVQGIRTVTAFNMKQHERNRLAQATRDFADALVRTYWRSRAVEPISQLVFGTVLIAVILLAVQYLVLPGNLDLALLLAFLFALFRLIPIAHTLNGQRGEWAAVYASLSNVASILDRGTKPYQDEGSQPAPTLATSIQFKEVSFAYEEDKPVLKSINLRIQKGSTTAIVGGSGSGKSTLVDLIPRFYDPDSGQILWDGVDLMCYESTSIRERIAVVSQSTFIFNDTVEANLRYGNQEASHQMVKDAAHKSNALSFIAELPEGFNTVLGDQGVRLSGGQRQRIAIARAILRDPEVLILDEATSALDSISERKVQESLNRLMDGRTVLAVAHRLSTVENADWIVVLEKGRIVEQGTYDELLQREGYLARYHRLQFQTA